MVRNSIFTLIGACVLFGGCAGEQKTKSTDFDITANKWRADSLIIDYDLSLVNPIIELGDSSALSGYSGCNSFFGEYTIAGDTLLLNLEGSTMMSCENDMFENQFVNILSQTNYYEVTDDNKLILRDMNMDFLGRFIKYENE